MKAETTERPQWEIERTLECMFGVLIRIAAVALTPSGPPETPAVPFIPTDNQNLPDNRRPAGRPVYFEVRLLSYPRHR